MKNNKKLELSTHAAKAVNAESRRLGISPSEVLNILVGQKLGVGNGRQA